MNNNFPSYYFPRFWKIKDVSTPFSFLFNELFSRGLVCAPAGKEMHSLNSLVYTRVESAYGRNKVRFSLDD